MKTLVILAHPNYNQSIANQAIMNTLTDKIDNLTVSHIADLYPNYAIDAEAEQQKLLQADTVVFQFPFYWYNMPAILKKWFDEVFTFNFAYGTQGDKLKGKNFQLSITIGGPASSYTPLGYNHFKVEDLLKPLEQTAYLSQMHFLPPIYENSLVFIPGVYNTREAVEKRALVQAHHLVERLNTLDIVTPEKTIEDFVTRWFQQFDKFENQAFFLQHINAYSQFNMVEGTFVGKEGFIEWYSAIQQELKPNSQHKVTSLAISQDTVHYLVALIIYLKAEKTNGEPLNITVKENWKLELNENNSPVILEYSVVPVQ